MDFKEIIKRVSHHFLLFCTSSVLAVYFLQYILFLIFADRMEGVEAVADMPVMMHDLTSLLILCVVSSLTSLVFYGKKELSKGHLLIRYAIHCFIALVTVLGVVIFRGWVVMEYTFPIIWLVILVVVIYAIIIFHDLHQSKKLANKLNQKLKEHYKK